MFQIVDKKIIAPDVTRLIIQAPKIANKRKPGQFVVIRVHEKGERIPLTIADVDTTMGTITLISQKVGKTTALLESLEDGYELPSVVGPLGNPTELEGYNHAVIIGGGIGIAVAYPIADALKERGTYVASIIGARTKELLILEDEMRKASDELFIATDDGSYGEKGFVTDVLEGLIHRCEDEERPINVVFAIGPVPMMKAVCKVTEPQGIYTVVSLNAIMVDGTGMCGACRVTVGGQTRFVCVDGPEFDGHKVNFDELSQRLIVYRKFEEISYEQFKKTEGCEFCRTKS